MNSNQSSSASSTSSAAPDSISRRAYEIWEQEGRPDGCELQHWLRAEQELNRTSAGSSASVPSRESNSSHAATDARPLQGTRAAGAANRDSRRSSASPFPGDKGNGRSPATARR